jgi:hypothetical protein
MNTQSSIAPAGLNDPAARVRRYRAGRVIEFLSTCPEFEQMQEKTNSFLQMGFSDLVDLYCMQVGWESLEKCYEHYVHDEFYALAELNAEIERLKLIAIVGGEPVHQAVLKHLSAFQPPDSPAGSDQPVVTNLSRR